METTMTEIQSEDAQSGRVSVVAADPLIVAVRYAGHRIGLYRVKQVGEVGMLLNHGGISFPVGTQLGVEKFPRIGSDALGPCRSATVVDNTLNGLRLAWCHVQAGETR